jgi:hypothetical protein
MASATVYCNNVALDGHIGSQGASYPGTVNVALTSDGDYTCIGGQWMESTDYLQGEYFFSFDLSGVSAGSDVSAATLSLRPYYNNSYGTETYEVYPYDFGTLEAPSDFRNAAALTSLNNSGAGLFASFGWTSSTATNAYAEFTNGSAILTAIEAACGGTLRLVLASAETRTATNPAANNRRALWSSAYHGTGYWPRLVVTYTEPVVWSGLIVTRKLQG